MRLEPVLTYYDKENGTFNGYISPQRYMLVFDTKFEADKVIETLQKLIQGE